MFLGKSKKVARKKKTEGPAPNNPKAGMNDMYTNILIKKFNHKLENDEAKERVGHGRAVTDVLASHRSNQSNDSPARHRK